MSFSHRSIVPKFALLALTLLGLCSILLICFPSIRSYSGERSFPRDEVISFSSNIRINPKDLSLSVTELTQMRATGTEVKFGIGRILLRGPLVEGMGSPSVKHTVKAVSRERLGGASKDRVLYPTSTTLDPLSNITIQMADTNSPLLSGDYEYTLYYLTKDAFIDKDGRHTLFWDATGWRTLPVKSASIFLFPPDEKDLPDLRASGYIVKSEKDGVLLDPQDKVSVTIGKHPTETNRFGEKRTTITYTASRPLSAGEAIIVNASWLSKITTPTPGPITK